MLIVVSGPPGSGKTTIAKRISSAYKIEFVSSGSIFRDLAEEMGLDVISLNKLAEADFSIDSLIDSKIIEVSKTKQEAVIESHIAAWILRNSRKDLISIYLTAPLEERAKRISLRDNKTVERSTKEIIEREFIHRKRFYEYYGVDITDLSVFDLTINTLGLSPDEIFGIIDMFIRIKGLVSKKGLV
ncbi:MAG: (d)CMP kinase [Thermoprotei archaeon]